MPADLTPITPISGLNALRKKLVEKTGHFQLVANYEGADYSDDGTYGANDLLNEAQDLLDILLEHPTQDRWLLKEQPAATAPVLVTFQNSWYVKEVWYVGHTLGLGRQLLEQSTVERIRDPNNPKEKAWANANILLAPELEGSSAGTFPNTVTTYIDFTDNEIMRGILVNPPYDEAHTLEILASFRHATISDANPTTFWTQAPNQRVLLDACRYLLETDHRNSQGQADLLSVLKLRVEKIYHKLIDETQQGPPERFRVIA